MGCSVGGKVAGSLSWLVSDSFVWWVSRWDIGGVGQAVASLTGVGQSFLQSCIVQSVGVLSLSVSRSVSQSVGGSVSGSDSDLYDWWVSRWSIWGVGCLWLVC